MRHEREEGASRVAICNSEVKATLFPFPSLFSLLRSSCPLRSLFAAANYPNASCFPDPFSRKLAPSLLPPSFSLPSSLHAAAALKNFQKERERERRERERGRSAECQMRLSLVRRVHNTVCGGARSFVPCKGCCLSRERGIYMTAAATPPPTEWMSNLGGIFASGHFWSRCCS